MIEIYLWMLRVLTFSAAAVTIGSLILNRRRRQSSIHAVYSAGVPPTLSLVTWALPFAARNVYVRELEALASSVEEIDAGSTEELERALRSISALPLQMPDKAYRVLTNAVFERQMNPEMRELRSSAAGVLKKQAVPLLDTAICTYALEMANLSFVDAGRPSYGLEVQAPPHWVERLGEDKKADTTVSVSVFIPVLGLLRGLSLRGDAEVDWSTRCVQLTISKKDEGRLRASAAQLKDAILSSGYSSRSTSALYRGLVEASNPDRLGTLPPRV